MIRGLRPYPKYKDSRIEWLGEVPAHWEVLPALAGYRPRLARNTGMKEKTVLSLSYGRIVVKPNSALHGLVPESFETYQIVNPGQIIVRTTDLQNDRTSLRVGYVERRGIITSAYLNLEAAGILQSKFAYQILNAYDLAKVIYGFGSGLRQNLGFEDLKRMPIPVPPRAEQSSIVRFVDYVDRRIRRYVRCRQKLISLLNEQKQAIINEVVTRGLDLDVRSKPSGVEWLGEVPEHWEVHRAKWLFREVDSRSPTGSEPHLSMSQRMGLVPSQSVDGRRPFSESYVGGKLCQPGDLVLNRLKAHLAVFAVSTQEGVVSPDYTVFRAIRPLQVRYFEHVLRTPACRSELRKRTKGIVQGFWRLYTDDFYAISLPVPPAEEQARIVDFLDRRFSVLDDSAKSLEREISLLHEYRTRLICDVVTGKLDVREIAAQLPDESEYPDENHWREEVDDDSKVEAMEEISEDDVEPEGIVPASIY